MLNFNTVALEIVENGSQVTEQLATAPALALTLPNFLTTLLMSLAVGLLITLSYTFRSRYTRSFATTLAIVPMVVSSVMLMIHHDVGTGIAVAGVFSLVRFRSLPGTAKDIGALFLAMGAGLVCGMGEAVYALVFTVVLCSVFVLGNHANIFGASKDNHRTLNITIPEDLDYTNVFEDLMEAYTTSFELVRVKTTNMGSMFRLTYHVTLRDRKQEKFFLDAIRCRNGNLEITVSKQETAATEL